MTEIMSIEDKLREADKSWNALTIGTVILEIMKADPQLTLLDIENMFRSIKSETTYLVAWPADMMPSQLKAKTLDGKSAKYSLWICVEGETDMLNQLAEFGLSMKANRNALREAGFSVVR